MTYSCNSKNRFYVNYEEQKKPMSEALERVSIITETYTPEVNGVAHTLSTLVRKMKERGVSVQIIRPKQHAKDTGGTQELETTLTVPGLPIPKYPELKFGLPLYARVYKALETFKPDSIYVATEGPLGWIAVRAAKKLNIQVVSGFHTNFHQYGKHYKLDVLGKLGYRYMRWFHNQTAATLVPTGAQAQQLIDDQFERVSVLSRGVDSEQFSPAKRSTELRSEWGVTDDDLVLIYVGRIAAEKNLQLVMRTYERMKDLDDRIRLVLVGNGPELPSIKKRYKDVIIAGIQRGESLAQHYASGDIFLFPSLTDTFGNVVTEAMASGLALVSFDYAAAREHTKHEESAVLAPFGEEGKYIQSATSLLERPNLLNEIRQAARRKAVDISWDKIVDEFMLHLTNAQIERTGHGNKQTTSSKSRVSVSQG